MPGVLSKKVDWRTGKQDSYKPDTKHKNSISRPHVAACDVRSILQPVIKLPMMSRTALNTP